jgi:hypothetical protein
VRSRLPTRLKYGGWSSTLTACPPFPRSPIFCPFDDGSHYRVRFSYADGSTRTLFAERRGCQGVGLGDDGTWVAWSATDRRFLSDLDVLFVRR